MAGKILVAYATKSGSTVSVAEAVGQGVGAGGEVEVRPAAEVADLSGYDAVIVGAPITYGWQREAMEFLKRHQAALSQLPVALFITCVTQTDAGDGHVGEIPVVLDPGRAQPPKNPGRLGLAEKNTIPAAYLEPILKAAPQVKPVEVAFFGGVVDFSTLGLPAKFILRVIVRVKAGDYRNWDAINAWAADIRGKLLPAADAG
jgi:menaquinone-dependent protoporphyrinogen oxidase